MIADTRAHENYYAVIFSSIRTDVEGGYDEVADRMNELAAQQPGFLGMESARSEVGITVSYWESEEAIRSWKKQSEHVLAQQRGRSEWYSQYCIRICRIEREYGFDKSGKV